MPLYSVTSVLITPIAAALSDHVGRKPLFVVAAATNLVTGVCMGLIPVGWVFSLMTLVQGAGDSSLPVGYALLADCVAGEPAAYGSGTGGTDCFIQASCALLRTPERKRNVGGVGGSSAFVLEMSAQFTLAVAIQSLGLVLGQLGGAWLLSFESASLAMATSGIVYLPLLVYAWTQLAETLPTKPVKDTPKTVAPAAPTPTTPQQYWEQQERRKSTTTPVPSTNQNSYFGELWESARASLVTGLSQVASTSRLRTLVLLSFILTSVQSGTLSALSTWGTWVYGWSAWKGALASHVVLIAGAVAGAVTSSRLAHDQPPHLVVAGMLFLSALACVPLGLAGALGGGFATWLFLTWFGFGLGCQPLILAMISNEAAAVGSPGTEGSRTNTPGGGASSPQGVIQGINCAFSTFAVGFAPYAYRYVAFYALADSSGGIHDAYDDDVLLSEPQDKSGADPGVFWWGSAFLTAISAVVAISAPASYL